MATEAIISELRTIAAKNDGLLKPEDVVESARPINSPLHTRFTWDDTEAANQYRLQQARQLIRTTIQYIEVDGKDQSFRVFCSLTPDREMMVEGTEKPLQFFPIGSTRHNFYQTRRRICVVLRKDIHG